MFDSYKSETEKETTRETNATYVGARKERSGETQGKSHRDQSVSIQEFENPSSSWLLQEGRQKENHVVKALWRNKWDTSHESCRDNGCLCKN